MLSLLRHAHTLHHAILRGTKSELFDEPRACSKYFASPHNDPQIPTQHSLRLFDFSSSPQANLGTLSEFRETLVLYQVTPAQDTDRQKSWLEVESKARELLSLPFGADDRDTSLARRVLLPSQATMLLGQVERLNQQTECKFQNVVSGLKHLGDELSVEVKCNATSTQSLLDNSKIDELQHRLQQLYGIFLGNLDLVGGQSAPYSSSKDKDSIIPHLIHMIKREFLELIAMFEDKKWRGWCLERDKTQQIPPRELGITCLSSIEKGLEFIKIEVGSCLSSSNRSNALRSLSVSLSDVSVLKIEIAGFETLLEILETLTQTIKDKAANIQSITRAGLGDFNKYCESVAEMLFWEFLPDKKHLEEHVRSAEQYLALRRLSTGLLLAHFVVAFKCLITYF